MKSITNREMKEKIIEIARIYGVSSPYGMAEELEVLVNQEVERRIKERMSDDEIKSIALRYAPIMMYAGITRMEDVNLSIRQDVIEMLVNLRSRLTQKTEGGGNG